MEQGIKQSNIKSKNSIFQIGIIYLFIAFVFADCDFSTNRRNMEIIKKAEEQMFVSTDSAASLMRKIPDNTPLNSEYRARKTRIEAIIQAHNETLRNDSLIRVVLSYYDNCKDSIEKEKMS